MPRPFVLIVVLYAAVCGLAQPAAAQTLWSGVLQVTAQTDGCAQQAFPSGVNMASTYRPHLAPEDQPSAFMFMPSDNAGALLFTNLDAAAQFNGSGRYANVSISNIATGGTFRGGYAFHQKPSIVAADTKFVTLTGKIKGYASIPDCTLTIQAFYTARVPSN
jgi:hypothetical protein